MGKTKIEWCTDVWNPVTGCSKISRGCKNCYAEKMSKRLAGRFGYPKDDPFRVTFHPEQYNKLPIFRSYKRVFVCSMGDLFHDAVKIEWVDRIMSMVEINRKADFLILTKRPGNMQRYFERHYAKYYRPDNGYRNLWLGVSVEDNDSLWRVEELMEIPAAVRWISYEPALERVDFDSTCTDRSCWRGGIDWIVMGAETGHKARPFDIEWARNTRDQCKAAGVPFFFKSAGKLFDLKSLCPKCQYKNTPYINKFGVYSPCLDCEDKKIPPDLQIREYPK